MINSEFWVPIPEGCGGILSNFANCGSSRGAEAFGGDQSQGFNYRKSNSWDLLGLYQLMGEQNLFGSTNFGLYGLDTVSVGTSAPERLPNQTIACIATVDFWLGSLGFGNQSSRFDLRASVLPGLVPSLKAQNLTPSLSYGYAVGASYSKET